MKTFERKKVLIFGLGLNQGGVGSAKFFAKQETQVKVTDLRGREILNPSINELKSHPDIEYTLGAHKYEDINWSDLIIKNPAIKPGNPYINYATKIGKQVKMDMDVFLQFVKPTQIIGVTGTKGKSTTASLINEILKSTGKNVIFAGNIGISVLDTVRYIKPDTLVVLEISSFQLESFHKHKVSPKWAIITNITPDHLNYYSKLEQYIEAKKIIGKYQTSEDFIFLRRKDPVTTKLSFLKNFKAKVIYFSKDDLPNIFKPTLKGEHNLENIAAAYQVGKTFGLSKKNILNILSKFKGVPFRMEQVMQWKGIKIINDTAATSPESGAFAVQTFPNCILICGGMNKRMDYTKYAKIVEQNTKKIFFLEGESSEEIKRKIKKKDKIAGTYSDFEKILQDIKKIVKKGDIILFSPAATSFNLFQNEWDRGRKFNEAVEKIFGGIK